MDDSATIIICILRSVQAQQQPGPWLRSLCTAEKRKDGLFVLCFLLQPHALLLPSCATWKPARDLRGELPAGTQPPRLAWNHNPDRGAMFIHCYSPKPCSMLNHSPHPERGANSCPALVPQSWWTWSLDFLQMALPSSISLNYLYSIHPHDPIQLHIAKQGSHTWQLG